MAARSLVLGLLSPMLFAGASARAQAAPPASTDSTFRVILLGTAGGPTFNAQRFGISTLVVAGSEVLLFDAGRSLTTGLARLTINPAELTRIFLTHLHSDHVISLPELLLFGWAQGRRTPLSVWGPTGTAEMMRHLQEAFAFDIHVRRDVDEKIPADGVQVKATDVDEGTVYESHGVRVTAFLVDHSPVAPAFGYRIDYHGHSVVLSGDTKPSANLVKFATGVDLLVHEVGRWKQDPDLAGPPDDRVPGTTQTRKQARVVAEHHTDGEEAGEIFDRIKPKLAVFSHHNAQPSATLALVRRHYAGPVTIGEDLMTIDIGAQVTVRK
ncbi:MAG: MBL fold metallo-hydrolase [Gemmatimonadaceae bacterium]